MEWSFNDGKEVGKIIYYYKINFKYFDKVYFTINKNISNMLHLVNDKCVYLIILFLNVRNHNDIVVLGHIIYFNLFLKK